MQWPLPGGCQLRPEEKLQDAGLATWLEFFLTVPAMTEALCPTIGDDTVTQFTQIRAGTCWHHGVGSSVSFLPPSTSSCNLPHVPEWSFEPEVNI